MERATCSISSVLSFFSSTCPTHLDTKIYYIPIQLGVPMRHWYYYTTVIFSLWIDPPFSPHFSLAWEHERPIMTRQVQHTLLQDELPRPLNFHTTKDINKTHLLELTHFTFTLHPFPQQGVGRKRHSALNSVLMYQFISHRRKSVIRTNHPRRPT